jgi:uncharacterized protein (UPF0264 family)
MRLLLSVTDAAEALTAAAAGAHIIDVKDPSAGALGRPAPGVVRAIRAALPAGAQVSVALGDGPWQPGEAVATALVAADEGADFVKLGLRGTDAGGALAALGAVREALGPDVRLIAAAFADFARAGSPPPYELPAVAAASGADGCLLDTAVKDGRGLLHWMDPAGLAAFVAACRVRGLLAALAGSLAQTDFRHLAPASPDIVGVRGAACDGDRVRGRVSAARVADLLAALSRAHATTSVP